MGTSAGRPIDYEPRRGARPAIVERDGETVRVVVPLAGAYAPVPRWAGDFDWLSLLLLPIWWLASWFRHAASGQPAPPRATFEIDARELRLTLRDRFSGETLRQAWPRESIVGFHASPDEDGLELRVAGYPGERYLREMPVGKLMRIAAILNDLLNERGRK